MRRAMVVAPPPPSWDGCFIFGWRLFRFRVPKRVVPVKLLPWIGIFPLVFNVLCRQCFLRRTTQRRGEPCSEGFCSSVFVTGRGSGFVAACGCPGDVVDGSSGGGRAARSANGQSADFATNQVFWSRRTHSSGFHLLAHRRLGSSRPNRCQPVQPRVCRGSGRVGWRWPAFPPPVHGGGGAQLTWGDY